MKKLVFIILVFLFGMNGNAIVLSTKKSYEDKLPIVLKGSFGKDIQIRGDEPIEISLSTSMLIIQFNDSLGELSINIEYENGNIVYSSLVNTSNTPVYMIAIGHFHAGDYTIIVEGKDGGAEAQFRIKK